MARQRMIKPEIWTDEKFVSLTPFARLLFIGTWNFADDKGILKYSSLELKIKILPADSIDIKLLVEELISLELLVKFNSGGREWLWIRNFLKHQKINRPQKSGNPPPPFSNPPEYSSPKNHGMIMDDSLNDHGVVIEHSPPKTSKAKISKNKINKSKCKQRDDDKGKAGEESANICEEVDCSSASVTAADEHIFNVLVKKIVNAGVTGEKARELVSSYPPLTIKNQLRWLPFRNLDNPAGGLITAIENDWERPASARESPLNVFFNPDDPAGIKAYLNNTMEVNTDELIIGENIESYS